MFLSLNDLVGKGLLVVVFGGAFIYAMSGFWELGTAYHQAKEDVEQYRREAAEQPVVGFIKGKPYHSRQDFAADYERLHQEQVEKWQEHHEWTMQNMRERRPDLGFDR
jgi:hypothetical protein